MTSSSETTGNPKQGSQIKLFKHQQRLLLQIKIRGSITSVISLVRSLLSALSLKIAAGLIGDQLGAAHDSDQNRFKSDVEIFFADLRSSRNGQN